MGKRKKLPRVGTKLFGKYHDEAYEAEIVKDDTMPFKKAVRYAGVNYPSMTAAAMEVTKCPVNGWRFWGKN